MPLHDISTARVGAASVLLPIQIASLFAISDIDLGLPQVFCIYIILTFILQPSIKRPQYYNCAFVLRKLLVISGILILKYRAPDNDCFWLYLWYVIVISIFMLFLVTCAQNNMALDIYIGYKNKSWASLLKNTKRVFSTWLLNWLMFCASAN